MDSTFCDEGDKAILESYPLDPHALLRILEFAYYVNFEKTDSSAALSVFVDFTESGLVKQHLVTISEHYVIWDTIEMKNLKADNNGWKYVAVLLPIGKYTVVFEATCGLPFESNVAIDNVLLKNVSSNDQLQNGTKLSDNRPWNFSFSFDPFESKDFTYNTVEYLSNLAHIKVV